MRVLLCTPGLDPESGGPARSVPQLAAALAGFGDEVDLWSPVPGPDTLPDCTTTTGVRRFSGEFARSLTKFALPDLVHDNGLWLPCHHQIAQECARRHIPRIVSPRGMLEPWALRHKRWKKRLAWWLYQNRDLRSARLLHATSDAELLQFRRLGLKQPVVVLANGVAFPCRQEAIVKLAGDAKTRHALFLGRLHRIKGLEMLVKAWSQVRPVGWMMHVVGPDEGDYRRKISNEVKRAGIASDWTFEDMAEGPAKWQWFARSDLFILPSFSENFGIVVAEALAGGTPVITTKGTPWRGLCEHQCGWWVDPTVDGIAGALREATALTVVELSEMGRRGATWAYKEFAWPSLAQEMKSVYQWMMGGGPKPECVVQ